VGFGRLNESDARPAALILAPDAAAVTPWESASEVRRLDPTIVLAVLLAREDDLTEQRLLGLGCDDVMTPPVNIDTLLMRLGLRIRQRGWSFASSEIVHIYDARVDFGQLRVTRADGVTQPLSRGLADVLRYFIANANQVVSRARICETLWFGHVIDPEGKNLDMHVTKLRRLLETPGRRQPRLFQSVRGVGYRMHLPEGTYTAQEIMHASAASST
jgi:DNA-binding response OmpR family regulator